MDKVLNQLSLDLWKDEYSFEFFELNNFGIIDKIIQCGGQVVLKGPKRSGKKHLSFYLSKKYDFQFFVADFLYDSKILDIYGEFLYNKRNCIWIVNDVNRFSRDVQSRFNSFITFSLNELNDEFFEFFLEARLKRVGIDIEFFYFNYIIERLECSYLSIDVFINYIIVNSIINYKVLRRFFI